MSLPASQQKALSGIEQALVSRDPRLTSLFSIFTRLTRQEAMPAIEQLGRRRWRPPQAAVIALVIVVITGLAVLGPVFSPGGCATAQRAARGAAPAARQPVTGLTAVRRCGAG